VIHFGRAAVVGVTTLLPAMASLAVSDEQARFALILASVVATVAGGIAWMDKRIDGRIKDHAESESKADALRHAAVMAEIRHVRELLGRGRTQGSEPG